MSNNPELIISENNRIIDISHKDFQKICRSCLNKNGMVNLFCSIHEGTLLIEIYKTLSPCQLNENDGLPNKLCYTCADFVKQLYTFKKRTLESELILQNICVKRERESEINPLNVDVKRELEHENMNIKQEKAKDDCYDSTENENCADENSTEDDVKNTRRKRTPKKIRNSQKIVIKKTRL
ncbi:hypothetical protein NQ314_002856 [Rhamnusium bicolor]|uniref:ZAD domain-containing protein n=1 Tax=Rhamnusium bicolor TaxID=1586634 RepID=A0AAV8ZQE5_9CUCU|nr:hypothetical protein NQ314_002856 [Rhamnusium bicolor]